MIMFENQIKPLVIKLKLTANVLNYQLINFNYCLRMHFLISQTNNNGSTELKIYEMLHSIDSDAARKVSQTRQYPRKICAE